MLNYLIRRLLLLPFTLFCIILINFVIINLAPGDPTTISEISPEGSRRENKSAAFGSDDRYLQFREHYGLTLPILFNRWPWIKPEEVLNDLDSLLHRDKMSVRDYDKLRIRFGDQARFCMPLLLKILSDEKEKNSIRILASRFFARGGTRQAILGPGLNKEQQSYNNKIGYDNNFLSNSILQAQDSQEETEKKVTALKSWYLANKDVYHFEPDFSQKISIFFFETRFYRYMSRVLSLDFGTLRNDNNKTVISEVSKRFKYSLTLALFPMITTFVFCLFFGLLMAYFHNQWPDYSLNLIFLILYAIPVFVVVPFLIEEIALNRNFPFTSIPIPLSGFSSPNAIYKDQTSIQRLFDILQHIALPLVAILYGSLASQARLARTAFLEVLRQDYVRTAKAKGVSTTSLLLHHVGRNASITIVTSIAGSLGVVLGGSLIVETLFEIDGFGKFFYDAVVNRDYNVIMFSALAGSFLSLLGYLMADLAYTFLDPRVTLD